MNTLRKVIQSFLICAALLVAAAAQEAQAPGPGPSEASRLTADAAHPAPPSQEGKATLYVYRHRRFEGAALKPSVYVDDKEMARMENGRYFVVKLEPGKHSVRSNDRASGVEVNMKPGAEYYIRVDMQTGFWKGHGRLTMILPEQGEYEVKQAKPLNDADVKDRELVVLSLQQP
jgi:hypothetical protein